MVELSVGRGSPPGRIREAATLDAILRARARLTPDRPAYLFLADGEIESASLTWGELDRLARSQTSVLRREAAAGDRALLLYPPGLDFIVAFFACLYARVVAVPAYPPRPRRDQPRLRAIVQDAQPKLVLTTGALLAGSGDILEREPSLRAPRWLAMDMAMDMEEVQEPAPGEELESPEPEAPAFLQYTSGSTALPKGVVVTQAGLVHNERMIGEAFGLDENAVVVGWLPLYHDMGLIGNVLQPLYCGGRCILMAPAAFLQRPRRWLEAISRYRGTTSGGPNFAYELCLQKIGPEAREGLDLSRWTVAFNGAEPVRADTLDRFAAAFGSCGFAREAFYPCYGLAEATLFVTGGRPGAGARVAAGEPPALRLVSSGHAWAGQQVVVVDPETRVPCPPDRVGEIWVSGPSVAPAYWGRPEASETELHARLADGSGSFLRTGDLGFLRDGELYVTGRRKDLIILRGRNHYPQDLELTAERAHPALRPGGGAAFSVEVLGEERLVVVFEARREAERHGLQALAVDEVAAAVRRSLAEEHEVQLHELVLIRPASLPRTSSGKVQRHRCRELYLDGGLAVVGRSALGDPETAAPDAGRGELEAPSGRPVEDFLHAALARVLRLDPARIDRELPMSSFGLDSLAAIELSHAVEREIGAAPDVAELLSGCSIAEAARELEGLAAKSTDGHGLARTDTDARTDEYPLSFGQQALWVLQGLAPASAAYTIAGAARLVEGVEPMALRRAVLALVERHPSLRTTFANGPQGPFQRVHPPAQAHGVWSQEDASRWSAEELERRVQEAAYRPFDLENGPVLRAILFDRGPGDPMGSVLVLSVHHIAADFWSLAVLLRELGELYGSVGGRGNAALPAPAMQYAGFVARQRQEQAAGRYDERLALARQQLAGAPPLDLPLDRPRPDLQTFRGALLGGRLGRELALAASALARRSEATLFMVLLAGFEALLARHGGQEDFLVGTPTSGRSSHELSGLVGYLVNPAPIRADLADDPDVLTLLGRVRRATLDALARQDLPFTLLAEGLGERDPSRPAVFQAMLVLERSPVPELEGLAAFSLGEEGARVRAGGTGGTGGLTLESFSLERPAAQLDLTLHAGEIGGDLAAAFEWNRDLFDASTVQRLLDHFARLLTAMTRHPERRLSELEMLGPAETQQILVEWNATAAPETGEHVHELVEAQVERTPEAPAVVFGEESLTYWELNARANRLAHHLARLGVGPDVRVGLCLERSAELVVALLATLKAGGAFVPVDPSYPSERIAYMLEDSRVPVALTEEQIAPDAPWRSGPDPGNPASGVRPDNLAYVLYTSGSTGKPKGAMNSHRAILNRLRWGQQTFGLTAADRVLQKTPASFDVSVWEFFWPLVTGACLVVARPGGHLDPPYLRDEIARSRLTAVHFVPSMLQVFLDQPGLDACAGLRRVFLSGEAVSRELASRFHASLGRFGVELHNLYGPAEAAVEVSWWPCTAEDGARPVPIGRPVDNVRLHVLDRHVRPVPMGCAGELCIAGVQVARGYLGRPDLTAGRFLPDPFSTEPGGRLYRTGDLARHRASGELEFLGRLDHQVKLGGVRIELGEIEHALASHEAVREAVVLARNLLGKIRLVAYVVPAPPEASEGVLDAAALRAHLLGKLPVTMIPSSWVFLPSLPLSPSGKVDRRALPEPAEDMVATAWAAPATAAEKALAEIWSEVLGRDGIGIHDNFFALGGDSILGIQILSRAAQAGLKLSPRQIFRHPTIAELAAVAEPIEIVTAEPEQASPEEGGADDTDFSESGLSEHDLQKLMSKLVQKEQGQVG
jgi:amino acid adenylation domain-containing protein